MYKEQWTNQVGQVKKAWAPSRKGGGDTRVKAVIMRVTSKKRWPVFPGKINSGDTVELTDVDD